ncbi:TPA: hypothetical protein HNW23_17915 [Escherichia coli]|nr:hypothetical protein [Escherichia coli]
MDGNIKGLVSAGHEMASELKAECGAVDMRSVAKLISDLATQLEVQLVRANALAAENAALKQSEKEFNNFCRQEYYGWEDNFTETPATDAFLAEVRAQGVEMFAECAYTLEHHDHAVSFAAELRKGGTSERN